jgi:hypothetical protein
VNHWNKKKELVLLTDLVGVGGKQIEKEEGTQPAGCELLEQKVGTTVEPLIELAYKYIYTQVQ